MSSRVFVDTLFVIALINKRDQHHDRAAELADQLEGQPLLVTDAVLLEIGNALARNFRQEAVEVIEEFLFRRKWKSSDSIQTSLSEPLIRTKGIKTRNGDSLTALRSLL